MIQINLLPDVKSTYISTQRVKRLVVVTALSITGVALVVVIILAGITYGSQRAKLSSLDKKIKQSSSQLQNIDGLNKILTIQNQLNNLGALHDSKPVTSRLFTFLPNITPTDVNISSIDIEFGGNTATITGLAVSFEAVNKFADTLKFTDYSTDNGQNKSSAFSSVVLSNFAKIYATSKYTATYTIIANFDPKIFSGEFETVSLSVPKITSTRSQTEQPDALFEELPKQSQNINRSTEP